MLASIGEKPAEERKLTDDAIVSSDDRFRGIISTKSFIPFPTKKSVWEEEDREGMNGKRMRNETKWRGRE